MPWMKSCCCARRQQRDSCRKSTGGSDVRHNAPARGCFRRPVGRWCVREPGNGWERTHRGPRSPDRRDRACSLDVSAARRRSRRPSACAHATIVRVRSAGVTQRAFIARGRFASSIAGVSVPAHRHRLVAAHADGLQQRTGPTGFAVANPPRRLTRHFLTGTLEAAIPAPLPAPLDPVRRKPVNTDDRPSWHGSDQGGATGYGVRCATTARQRTQLPGLAVPAKATLEVARVCPFPMPNQRAPIHRATRVTA